MRIDPLQAKLLITMAWVMFVMLMESCNENLEFLGKISYSNEKDRKITPKQYTESQNNKDYNWKKERKNLKQKNQEF